MINASEQDEREYLEEIKEKLTISISRAGDAVRHVSEELRKNKAYIYEHQSGMDEADMVAAGQSINRMASTGESAVSRKKKLMKLLQSPYFGRIDFVAGGPQQLLTVYIGIYTFSDDYERVNWIYDWRAPISSMFYDFELGDAGYDTPSGRITGQILLKRQYRIRDGAMDFMIENAVNIHDEILQKELSRSSDEKMKNIVATIQRDQNAVIRNETARVMIIQGVAGSGKTSIALHRIAFLLYRYRETIASKDILIISPNKVFADYISNVLPELGEEHIPEMGMEELAEEVLESKYRFQTFFQQVSTLMRNPNPDLIERIRYKSSFEFLSMLNRYLVHMENTALEPVEIRVAGVVVPYPFIQERFKAYHRMPMLMRIPEVVSEIQQWVRGQIKRRLSGREKSKIWEAIPRMIKVNTLLDLYKNFYKWLGKPELFKMGHQQSLEFSDVFPLIYCKIRFEGTRTYGHVRHLLVDEMQDYTPVQYAVTSRLFQCNKTILGDVSQTINPYSASSADGIHKVFPHADVVKLYRSYRSTVEITSFTQRILANPDLIAMERHGALPEMKGFRGVDEEIGAVRQMISRFENSGYQSLGIICKTQQRASSLHDELALPNIHLLTAESTAFTNGIVISTIHLAKGLEFDQVIVPFASDETYCTDMDRNFLYIACTRAMHELSLTYTGEKTTLVR